MKLFDAQLPETWEWQTIAERYRITKKPREVIYANFDAIPFIAMEDVPAKGREAVDFKLRNPGNIASGTYFEKDDVLLSKITPSFENGKQGMGMIPTDFGVGSTELIPLQAIDSESNNRFLFFYLLHPEVRAALTGKMEGSTGRQRVPERAVREFPLPTPPRNTQNKIADILWKVQQAIEVEERLVLTTKELKQSALRRLFTRGLRNESLKETELGMIPQSWTVYPLTEIARIERGRFLHRPRNEPRFYGGRTPFVQTGDVVRSNGLIQEYTQSLNDEGVSISRVFPRGTILITIAANIGFTGVLDFDSACPDSLIGITPVESVDTWYLEYFLQTQQSDMDRRAPKGTQKNINIQFLNPWPVSVPPLGEQREIAKILRTIDSKISVHERKRATLQELFKTLLHQLMTGEIDVTDLDIDKSEVTQF